MTNQPAVYILASKRNGTLYIGVTSDLQKRTWEHKSNAIEGFTKKYGVHQLVYYELHGDMLSAITREKQMKKWNGLGSWKSSKSKIQIGRTCGMTSFRKRGSLDSRVRGNDDSLTGKPESLWLAN
jgi:putative endonuclease